MFKQFVMFPSYFSKLIFMMIDTGNGVPFMAFASDENSHYISLT